MGGPRVLQPEPASYSMSSSFRLTEGSGLTGMDCVCAATLRRDALIEREGARGAFTALITIEGFRDAVEIGYEHDFAE